MLSYLHPQDSKHSISIRQALPDLSEDTRGNSLWDKGRGKMKQLFRNLLVTVLFAGGIVHAQTKADEAAVRNIPQAFAAAWANHDSHQLAKLMSDDVDFVNVGADWVHGRTDFERFHTRLLSGRFKESTLTPLEVRVRFLRPDQAVLHWNWKIENDRNQDLTTRKPRLGLFTMIVEKRDGQWLVIVAQNTNRIPAPHPDPEMEGITLPIVFPDVLEKP
jgi:uncharacterized protein (TIGR02246 family)